MRRRKYVHGAVMAKLRRRRRAAGIRVGFHHFPVRTAGAGPKDMLIVDVPLPSEDALTVPSLPLVRPDRFVGMSANKMKSANKIKEGKAVSVAPSTTRGTSPDSIRAAAVFGSKCAAANNFSTASMPSRPNSRLGQSSLRWPSQTCSVGVGGVLPCRSVSL
jgi:hypothetical protein